MPYKLKNISLSHCEILVEEETDSFISVVAVVKHNNRWLLGLARNGNDRQGKWCCPGGRIKTGEKPKKAAERECYEETGIKCKATGEPFRLRNYNGIAFVPCEFTSTNYKIDVNDEFSAAGFFTMSEINKLKPLYKNVIDCIDKAKRSKK